MVQDMLQWGWKIEGLRMQPIVLDLEPVPGSLLKFVQCKCKLSMKNPCISNISSCHKHRQKYCGVCGDYKGENCKEIGYGVRFK